MSKLFSVFLILVFCAVPFASHADEYDDYLTYATGMLTDMQSAGADQSTDPDIRGAYADLQAAVDEYKHLLGNYREAKARENSTANKMIDAAAIGATGIGASQLFEGMAEKSADTASAQAIAAYTASIKCAIPGTSVMNIKNGDNGIAPIPSKFTSLKGQMNTIVANLTNARSALGQQPGIEAQFVDKTSLYNYGENGQGGFKSTLDTAQQRLDSGAAQKLIDSGTKTAAVGLGIGVVGNLLVNDIAPKLGQGDVTKYGSQKVTASDFKKTFTNIQNFYNVKCIGVTNAACGDLGMYLKNNQSLVQ